MPNPNDGPAAAVTDTGSASTTEEPLPGFADAMTVGAPPIPQAGEPKAETAVETRETEKAPEKVEDKPATSEAAKTDEDKPDPAHTVNFDGLSPESKTYWETALKAGHAAPADVERARKESLFQQAWTRSNQQKSKEVDAAKAKAEAAEKRIADLEAEFASFRKVRDDPTLHAGWLDYIQSVQRGEVAPAAAPVDAETAKRIADERFDTRERERAERSAKQQEAYDARAGEMRTAIQDWMRIHSVAPDKARDYCGAIEASLHGKDPILHFAPEELVERLTLKHEAEAAKAEAASLREQLGQRASKQANASKQSFRPPQKVSDTGPRDPWKEALEGLGVAQDMSNVTGFGGWKVGQ